MRYFFRAMAITLVMVAVFVIGWGIGIFLNSLL